MMKPDIEANTFKDNVASRASISEEVRRFSGGVERRDEGSDQPKYLEKADELIMPERTTMQVSMRDIQVHNDQLQETIVQPFSHRGGRCPQGKLQLQLHLHTEHFLLPR